MASHTPNGLKRLPVLVLFFSLFLSLILSACGSDSPATTTPAKKADVTPPKNLISQGTLTVGTDPTYFPMEYVDQTTNNYAGFDIELSQALADHMGLKLNIVKTSFDTLLTDLDNKRFDIANASIYVSEKRKAKYDFVTYMTAGEALLVPTGNPKHLKALSDLCGLTVGVGSGTEQKPELDTASADCQSKGKPAINQTVLQSETEVIQLLVSKRADATFQGSLSAGYYNTLHPGLFEFGGPVSNAGPSGIAIRKGDTEMSDAITKALKALHDDGTYKKLCDKYGFPPDERL
ncbi:ABC transporter substrate-binding protein [Tengunoibacter tsumagoiensis]|uniref:Solute-binding protein family 3/N-terminal domain-containing protein n=1 Tax=Tengunoibacter tsumagoiensis TaxID=2014871 RepID=A0A402A2P7_9CHLR|nr:ABC transporter substrate-binding protein [Tengunoibacter tsumagoiensis]GCE13410.1 hypothetical protein KTT_32690 [Tengunoibacter tsumagoiensis]